MRITRRRIFASPVVITLAAGGCGTTSSNPPGQVDAQIDTPFITENPPPPMWVTEAVPSHKLQDVWGSGPTDVYAVGAGGTIMHSDGNGTWAAQTSGVTVDLYSVWGSGPNDIYAGGFGNTLLHSTGNGTWTPQTIPSLGIQAIGGSGPTDVYIMYANSAGKVHHSTGNGTWTPVTIGEASSTITVTWGTSATNIYFAGGTGGGSYATPYILHGPSNPSTEMLPPLPDQYLRNVFAMWGSGPNDIYAVGNTNTILHSVGAGSWTLQSGPLPTATYVDVWGSSANDLFVVPNEPYTILRSTGDGTWYADNELPMQSPSGIWGTGPYNVYVVGDVIAHKLY